MNIFVAGLAVMPPRYLGAIPDTKSWPAPPPWPGELSLSSPSPRPHHRHRFSAAFKQFTPHRPRLLTFLGMACLVTAVFTSLPITFTHRT